MNSFRPVSGRGWGMRCKAGLELFHGNEIEAAIDAAVEILDLEPVRIEAAIDAADATGGHHRSGQKRRGETFGSRPLLVHLAN